MSIDTIDSRSAAMLMGVLIFLAFGTWGGGSALMHAGAQSALPMMLFTTPVVVGIGLLSFGILRNHAPVAATTYLTTRLFEASLLTVAAVLMAAGNVNSAMADAGHLAYLAAMAGLGIGSVPFCVALLTQRMVPNWLGWWGVVGYASLAGGMISELAGLKLGLFPLILGGLFELIFAFWLIVWGFSVPIASRRAAV